MFSLFLFHSIPSATRAVPELQKPSIPPHSNTSQLTCLAIAGRMDRGNQSKADLLPDWWFTGQIPNRPAIHRFDHLAFERWAKAQPVELAPVVKFLRENLHEVGQEEFEQALRHSFSHFLKSRSNKKPLLFILPGAKDGKTKSQIWVAGLLRGLFPEEMKNAEFIVENDALGGPNFEAGELKKICSGNYHIVMADDGSYSGRQLYLTFHNLLSEVRRAGLPDIEQVNLVYPYVTNRAKARLGGERTKTPIYFSHLMPTVGELIKSLAPEQRKGLQDLGDNLWQVLDSENALTFFDHKLPDGISIPVAVWEGLIFEMKDGHIKRKTQTVPSDRAGGTWERPITIPFLMRGNTPYQHEN